MVATLNGSIVIVSILGASVLGAIRHGLRGRVGPAQWLGDALNIGTLFLLAWIAAGQFFEGLQGDQLMRQNQILISLALTYCVYMIGGQLIASLSEPRRR
jgi:hypothetical protein